MQKRLEKLGKAAKGGKGRRPSFDKQAMEEEESIDTPTFMKIGVPREVNEFESRVAMTPSIAKKLRSKGFEVYIEAGAGEDSSYYDEDYRKAGATILHEVRTLYDTTDIIMKILPPEYHPDLKCQEHELLHSGQILVSLFFPARNEKMLDECAAKGVTVLAMDQVPRITKAQKLDCLSSMSNIAGYRAVIEASNLFGSFFTGQTTAAGNIPPAKVISLHLKGVRI